MIEWESEGVALVARVGEFTLSAIEADNGDERRAYNIPIWSVWIRFRGVLVEHIEIDRNQGEKHPDLDATTHRVRAVAKRLSYEHDLRLAAKGVYEMLVS